MNTDAECLVTGASGFIGRRLLHPGDRGLFRTASGLPGGVRGDLSEPSSLARACQGVKTVFHCAGYAHAFSGADPQAHWRINYEGTLNLLQAAAASGVERFIFASSVKAMAEPVDSCADEEAPGDPKSAYGQAKRAAEEAVLEAGVKHGMHVVVLRFAMVYGRGGRGNMARMVHGVNAGWFPPLPETGNRRSLVHVDDVVEAMRLVDQCPEANGKSYIVAESMAYSGRAIYEAIREALALPRRRWAVPEWTLRAGGRVGDRLGSLLGRRIPLNTEMVSRLLDSECYSPAKIDRELGWRSKVSLVEGLREMIGTRPEENASNPSERG